MEVQNLQVKRNVSAQTAVVGTDQQGKSTKEKASRTGYVHATDREEILETQKHFEST